MADKQMVKIPCAYCKRLNTPENTVSGRVISRQYRGLKSPLRHYCKDKPCQLYDQMSAEG